MPPKPRLVLPAHCCALLSPLFQQLLPPPVLLLGGALPVLLVLSALHLLDFLLVLLQLVLVQPVGLVHRGPQLRLSQAVGGVVPCGWPPPAPLLPASPAAW
jgi:hypothetical protein